jgi:hypothetical protein
MGDGSDVVIHEAVVIGLTRGSKDAIKYNGKIRPIEELETLIRYPSYQVMLKSRTQYITNEAITPINGSTIDVILECDIMEVNQ